MFWADTVAKEVSGKHKKAGPIVIRDEKTPSGLAHVGSMRGVAIHGVISEILTESGVANIFKYELNDMDPMDGFPDYLPETFRQYMGVPLSRIPSPDSSAKTLAEYFANDFKQAITRAGFTPEFYNVSELYVSGQMDESIRIALTRAADIRRIYREISGSQKPDDWYPLQVICENCGKVGTTKVVAFDGEKVSYRCEPTLVTWAKGCNHEGSVSPFGGKAKFPFKVEWAAKWKVVGVELEGAGKDHSTKGGARDVASHIAKEIFAHEPPVDVPYEFLLVGGKKMSSSKGEGSRANEIATLVPMKIFRLALLHKDPMQQFNFDLEGDTIPLLYDLYDKLAESYWGGVVDDDYARLFTLIHQGKVPGKRFLPRFSQVAHLVQMPHLDIHKEAERLKDSALSAEDIEELEERTQHAGRWLSDYAPEKYVFKVQSSLPEAARSLSAAQKSALGSLAQYVASGEMSGEALHHQLHEIKESQGIAPAELFGAIYLSFLGKTHGPKAGWFLSVLDKQFVQRRLEEASR